MEHFLEELSKRDDLVQVLALAIVIIGGLVVFWLTRIMLQMAKNWGSTSDKNSETMREVAVNNTQLLNQISTNLNQSSSAINAAASKLTAISSRQEDLEARQAQTEAILASAVSILDRMEKTTREADEAVRTEINEHETRAIQRSNENLEVSRDILGALSDVKLQSLPERLENIGTQNNTIIASLDTVRKDQLKDKEQLKKIEESVLGAITDGKDRDSRITQVLDVLTSLEGRLKVLQTKPLEVAAVYSKPSGGDAA